MALPNMPYAGCQVALATRHGKERVIGRALRHGLGADLLHLPQIDTDALGSFCGTVARRGSALEACIAKAELAMEAGGTGLAIASEGSFGPHPAAAMLAVGVEWMVFLDRQRGLTIQEELLAPRTNFSHTRQAAGPKAHGQLPSELQAWLRQVGFPAHALIVRPNRPGPEAADTATRKGIRELDGLGRAIDAAAAASSDGLALVETDMRAHCNPTRMASIRRLSFRLMRRVATPCPACSSPGWGVVDRLEGLPCDWCGLPTPLIRWLVEGCAACNHRLTRPRPDGRLRADPGYCPRCNP